MFHNKKILSKKGNIGDITEAMIIVFSLVLVLFIVWASVDKFNTEIASISEINKTNLDEYAESYTQKWLTGFDVALLFILLGFMAFSFIASTKLPVNLIVSIFAFVYIAFVVFASMILSNMYGRYLEMALFTEFASNTTIMPIIMPNLPYIAIVYSLIVLVGLYGKKDSN
jgi:hypothetical protein